MASHPSPGDNHQSTVGGPKEHKAKQRWQRETHSVTYVTGLSTLSDLSHIVTVYITLKFLLSRILPNSLSSLHKFSSESATVAVSSANIIIIIIIIIKKGRQCKAEIE